jgi:hypothetical protein
VIEMEKDSCRLAQENKADCQKLCHPGFPIVDILPLYTICTCGVLNHL